MTTTNAPAPVPGRVDSRQSPPSGQRGPFAAAVIATLLMAGRSSGHAGR
jgi:hypothetical protein